MQIEPPEPPKTVVSVHWGPHKVQWALD